MDEVWALYPYQQGYMGGMIIKDRSDAGIAVIGPGARVHGGGKSRIVAGLYPPSHTGCPQWSRSAGSYIARATPAPPDPAALLVHDPNVTWEGCWGNGGAEQSLEFPTVHPGDAHPGRPRAVRATGPSSSIVSVFASMIHPGRPIELPVGDVWLDPNLVVEIGCGAVDNERELHLSTPIPDWMKPGDALMYQAARGRGGLVRPRSLDDRRRCALECPASLVVHP